MVSHSFFLSFRVYDRPYNNLPQWFNRIVIRIRCDAKNSDINLGLKFGCEPDEDAVRLIQLTMDLGLTLHGFSFHVGSPCGELNAFSRGIGICRRLVAIAKSMGCKDLQLIDIGGGFSGKRGTDIDKVRAFPARLTRIPDSFHRQNRLLTHLQIPSTPACQYCQRCNPRSRPQHKSYQRAWKILH